MWLLDTHTLQLRLFQNPPAPDNGGAYAILSHVWSAEGEQGFQELKTIIASSDASRLGKETLQNDERISAKIRDCCAFARCMGYRLLWIDSCCIDKTSSAELSEAINSMYEWYSRAAVCYAFLYDVGDDQDPSTPGSEFRNSRWFRRGWTLQELVAPRDVLLLSRDWRMLGTKEDLAAVIEEITGVDQAVLLFEKMPASVSVACRMSWASRRVTTRVEDEAYSLLGLFGICMPTIYGEGRNAFLRLQEEILKQIPDQSIFVWGITPWTLIDKSRWDNIAEASRTSLPKRPIVDVDMYGRQYREHFCRRDSLTRNFLFASSPADFRNSAHISPIRLSTLASRLGAPVDAPNYIFTSYGVRMRLPTIPDKDMLGDSCLAILACEDDRGRLAALILNTDGDLEGSHAIGSPWSPSIRGVLLRTPLARRNEKAVAVTATDVCIAHRPVFQDSSFGGVLGFVETRLGFSTFAMFRGPCTVVIPQWTLTRLAHAGCVPSWTGSSFTLDSPTAGPCSLAFAVPRARLRVAISLALCIAKEADCRYALHAALTHLEDGEGPVEDTELFDSNCRGEHVASWADATRAWDVPALGSVALRFKNWPCGDHAGDAAMVRPLFALEVQVSPIPAACLRVQGTDRAPHVEMDVDVGSNSSVTP